jgi:SecD/SecF fusion protein
VSTRRSNLLFILGVLVAIVGAALLAIPGSPIYQKPKLGLDLQGGLEIVLEATPPQGRELTDADLDRSVSIIRERIDKLGVSETEVRKQGNNQIAIQIPGVKDPERAAEIIGKTAQLELYKFEANLIPPSRNAQGDAVPSTSIFNLLAGQQSQIKSDKDAREWYLFDDKKKRFAGPRESKAEILKIKRVQDRLQSGGKLPKGWKFMGVPQKTIILTCGIGERYCPSVGEDPDQNYYYLLLYQPRDKEKPVPEMTGNDLKLSGTRQDFGTNGEAIVLMDFTDKGAGKFHEVTRDIVESSRFRSSQGRGEVLDSFAIVLDGRIKSAPTVDPDENPDGIPGDNGAQITGIGDVGEAKDLALVLQTGALPIEFVQVDRTQVSATLGKDSLNEALRASIAGLVIVALFLLIVYRFLGLVAVFGLAIYSALLYAVILLFDVTLTLPGFAGMILAIGVAADANIVIFERIKEEAAARKSIRAAIAHGYRKGFATIVDANVVTAITALILFAVATAGVRGFAFMLLLGTGLSIVTAVFATRALLGLLAGFKWFDNPKFMGAEQQKMARWQMFDAVGKRRIWFTIAGALIAVSIGSLIFKGLNLGIDFRGGTQMTFVTERPVDIADVRSEAQKYELGDAVIQGRGDAVAGDRFREFQIKAEPLTSAEQRRVVSAIETEFDATSAVRNVSASFSGEILRGAILAMIVSFLLITIYIWARFQWRFAVPILRTIANDGLIAIGIYSLAGREVTASTVAAFLTIIGYSIYDTIIIFDRVRENLPLMRRSTVKEIINVSLWETVRRSVATTIIVLLPVSALFLFGGETLQDFAFAILIGISISAFSTIFIAAPFLAVLLEHSPEYKGRKGTGEAALVAADGDGRTPLPPPAEAVEEEEPIPAAASPGPAAPPAQPGSAAAKRERRRQRRRTRPHGRAR